MVCHFVCPTLNPAKESTVYTHQCQIDGVDGWMVDDCSNLQGVTDPFRAQRPQSSETFLQFYSVRHRHKTLAIATGIKLS